MKLGMDTLWDLWVKGVKKNFFFHFYAFQSIETHFFFEIFREREAQNARERVGPIECIKVL